DVEERARLLAAAELDQALALVERDVGERADRDGEGGIAASLRRVDDDVGDADELLFDRGHLPGFRGHRRVLTLPAPGARFRFGDSMGASRPAVGLAPMRRAAGALATAPAVASPLRRRLRRGFRRRLRRLAVLLVRTGITVSVRR